MDLSCAGWQNVHQHNAKEKHVRAEISVILFSRALISHASLNCTEKGRPTRSWSVYLNSFSSSWLRNMWVLSKHVFNNQASFSGGSFTLRLKLIRQINHKSADMPVDADSVNRTIRSFCVVKPRRVCPYDITVFSPFVLVQLPLLWAALSWLPSRTNLACFQMFAKVTRA